MRAGLTGEIVALETLEDIGKLESPWRELEQQADTSFFVSWGWIGPWLRIALEKNAELYLYRCKAEDRVLSLGIVSRAIVVRHKVFRSQVLALNEVPRADMDMTIEYNGLLTLRGHEAEAWACFKQCLLTAPLKWDELIFSGITTDSWASLQPEASELMPVTDEQFCPWVRDISTVAGDLEKLLAPLSRNRRWQIRRSIKAFAQNGELVTYAAASTGEALTFFESMEKLHTQRWNRVGQSGSFANSNWVSFHRAIITDSFARGDVQILRVSAGEQVIGYIYSFIWRGVIYMIQTGFTHENDNTRRPGYVSHCLAMVYNSTRDITSYDFMHGDAEYKSVLGNAQPSLIWGRLQRPRPVLWLENRILAVYRALRSIRSNQSHQAAVLRSTN